MVVDPRQGERLFEVARAWLAAERSVTGLDRAARHEALARSLSAEYGELLASSSTEQLEAAWHAAIVDLRATQPGSSEWTELDAVGRLLHTEWRMRTER
jgi:hypothetical protein